MKGSKNAAPNERSLNGLKPLSLQSRCFVTNFKYVFFGGHKDPRRGAFILKGCKPKRVVERNLSVFLQGSGGIPLIRKVCYAVGGVPNQVTTAAMAVSLQIFLLDVVQVAAALQYENPSCPDFHATIRPPDGGLLRVPGSVCEPGLGRRDGPSDRVPGGPQSLDRRGKTQPLVGRPVAA